MVATHACDMIGEIALALEMGADAVDITKAIHLHASKPTHEASLQGPHWQQFGLLAVWWGAVCSLATTE